ncbi:MAG: hypothetical protein PHR41_00625 [Lactococcus chungangensis]|nr:hypothetical protein [Lactococcus chungangensis]
MTQLIASNQLTLTNINDGQSSYTHTAYAYSADGTDRFTTVYPNLNLLSQNDLIQGYLLNTGSLTPPNAGLNERTSSFLEVDASQSYTVQVFVTLAIQRSSWCGIGWFDENQIFIKRTAFQESNVPVSGNYTYHYTVQPPSNAKFVRISFRMWGDGKLKLEQGSTATPWLPSSSEVTPADYPTYIGTYSDTNVNGSTDPSKYTWAVFKGVDGQNGADAPTITNVQDQIYLSTSNTAQSGGSWGGLIPAWSSGKYYWSRVATTFSNGMTTYSIPVLDEALNQAATNQIKVTQLTQDLDGFKTTVSNTYLSKSDASGTYADKVSVTSQITQLATDINLRVSKGDVTSQINIEAGRTLIDTKKLLLNADTVKFSGSAFIPNAMIQNLSAEKITAGTLNAANVNIINLNAANITTGTLSGANLSMNLNTGEVLFQKGVIKKEDSRFSIDITNGVIESYSPNGGYTLKDGEISFRDISAQSPSSIEKYGSISYDWFPGGLFSSSFDAISVKGTAGWGIGTANAKKGFLAESTLGTFIGGNNKRCSVFAEEVLELYGGKTFGSGISQGQAMVRVGVTDGGSAGGDGIDISANKLRIYTKSFSVSLPDQASIVAKEISMSGKCSVLGDLSVLGSKNAIHVTRDGVRATPAYETAESYLGDIGRNYTRENCEVWVEIDQLFSDTVNTDIAYEVFLQAYDNARFWVSDFRSDKFLVKSDKPMSRFAWEIKAKRRGYENERLVLQEDFDNKMLLDTQEKGVF